VTPLPDESTCRECHQDDGCRYEDRLRQTAHAKADQVDSHGRAVRLVDTGRGVDSGREPGKPAPER